MPRRKPNTFIPETRRRTATCPKERPFFSKRGNGGTADDVSQARPGSPYSIVL